MVLTLKDLLLVPLRHFTKMDNVEIYSSEASARLNKELKDT